MAGINDEKGMKLYKLCDAYEGTYNVEVTKEFAQKCASYDKIVEFACEIPNTDSYTLNETSATKYTGSFFDSDQMNNWDMILFNEIYKKVRPKKK